MLSYANGLSIKTASVLLQLCLKSKTSQPTNQPKKTKIQHTNRTQTILSLKEVLLYGHLS